MRRETKGTLLYYKHLVEHLFDFRVDGRCEASGRTHWLIEDDVNGETRSNRSVHNQVLR